MSFLPPISTSSLCRPLVRGVASFLAALFLSATALAQGSSTYQITSTSPASLPAGAAGATLTLAGTLPDFTQNTYQVCFYTGAGSNAPITPAVTAGVASIAIPAGTILGISTTSFTSANAYAVPALVSIVPSGATCDGSYEAFLTNSLTVPIAEPVLGTYTGPTSIPQTNPSTGLQSPPTAVLLTGTNFALNTIVSLGTYSSVTSHVLTPTSISVTLPAAFASSPAGSTANLTICNTSTGATNFCSAPSPPITLTVASLYPSSGALTASPSPATTSGQTTITAQFSRGTPGSAMPEPGAPSGTVAFSAGSTTLPSTRLVLDRTATFVQQTSSVSTPVAATPAITPAAGSYLNSASISIADSTPGASLFYTLDGTSPTTASTPYTAPFLITTTSTVTAIASAPGLLNSTPASSAYTVTATPPTQLAFLVQPTNAAIGTAIAPALQVAIEDVNGNLVNTSTLPVTIALANNPGSSILAGTQTVAAVRGIATFPDLSLNNIATGYTLTATSGNLTPATSAAFNVTPYPINMTLQSALIGINSTLSGTVTLGHAAPQGGVIVTLASDTPANITIAPSSLTIAASQTTASFTYSGVAAGSANLTATATNYLTGTAAATATAAQVSLGTIPPVAPGQTVSLALSLPTAAPPGGTTVTFTSSNTSVASVTQSVFVPAGQRTAAINPQITGFIIGTTVITANAPGFAPDTRSVNVTVVASFNPNTTNLNLITSTNTTLNLAAPAPAGGIAFTLTSDNPAIATIASPVTVAAGATSVPVSITGTGNGSTTIRADSPGVSEATGTVNINSAIQVSPITTGVLMQYGFNLSLPVNPSVPTTVTVTIADPSIGTISQSTSAVGTRTITFPNITSSYIGYVVLQGQSQGATTLSVAAPGYTTGTATMTVAPSGFSLYPYYYYDNFSTTTFASPTQFNLYTTVFDAVSGNNINFQLPLNPGIANISVPVTSSNTAVGTIVTSPIVFHAGDSYQPAYFQPLSAGTSTLAVGTPPAPFSVPNYYQTGVATVTTPAIGSSSVSTGANLQNQQYFSLPVAPPNPVTVTISSNNPNVLLSTDPTVVGTSSVTFPNVTGGIGTVYFQGQTAGTSTVTISASGYSSGTDTVTIYPTGFTYYLYYGDQSFSTLTTSDPTNITIYTATLDPNSFAPNGIGLPVSPGVAPITVPITSATTSVGTLSPTSLVFNPADTQHSTSFQPVSAGTSVISIGTPQGYTTPSSYTSLTATVTAPTRNISFGNDIVTGSNLEIPVSVYLSSTPATPITVTVTTNNPAVTTISNAAGTVGTTTTTFTNVNGTYVGNVYVQGQAQGTTTLTATAPGYSSASNNITVYPSGFGFSYYNGNSTTTTFSPSYGIYVYAEILDPTNNLNEYGYPQTLNPGLAPINVPVISSAPSVGTITTSPVVFNPQSTEVTTTFQPISAGTSTITLGTPAGFSTPLNNALTATVNAPTISLNNVETGLNLETSMFIGLPQTPPNPVTVTVTSNGPQIAVISKDGTVIGGTTLTFTNVTSTNVGTIFVQGASLGTTTLTVSAPGYNNGNANVTVDPSGFSFYGGTGDFTTSSTSNPYTLTITADTLTPGTLTIVNYYNQFIAPQAGSISVPVTSANLATGTITTSPIVFTPGGQTSQQTGFKPVATGTSVLTVQPPPGFSTPSQYQQITATVQ